jgi:pyruvate dehydrogenase E2 component (dihydrolipoamide acetyltransferase)
MKKEIKLPDIADNVDSGYLSRVLVSVGDVIEEDQSIIEVETDKATTDIPSPYGGKIVDIKVNEGDEIKVGQIILVVESGEEKSQDAGDKTQDAGEKTEEKTENQGPRTQEKNKDERPKTEGKTAVKDQEKDSETKTTSARDIPESTGHLVPASPSVRRFARELGVDITKVKGTGPAGRISDDDVKAFTKQALQDTKTIGQLEYPDVPDFSQWGEVDIQSMSRIRQITAESTVNSWQTIPQVVQFDKADITEAENFRKAAKQAVEKAGGKLTMTSILLKISALALKQFPKFNASVDMKNKKIIYKDYINIGVAVDTPNGLLVPIVRDVDKKSLTELSLELGELAEKARNRKLTTEEMQGGNFTISNLGGIGGTSFTPIVYPNQVAILGVSRSSMEQVYRDGEFVARNMLPLSLSYDHRLIDGADGARFLRWLCGVLEQPFTSWL